MLACATSAAPTPNSPLRGAVLRLAVVLLYTAGLRRGEVTGLTLGDVDAGAGVVRVRESKFHKSRLVPLSTDAGRELRRYLRADVDFATISQWLGHSSVNTTMRYARVDIDLKRTALSQVFPEALAPPKGGQLAADRTDVAAWLRRL